MVVKMKRLTPAVNIRLSPTTIYCICTNCQAPFCVCQPTYLWIVLYLSLVRSLFEKYFLSFTENISSLARLLRYVATTVRAGAWSPRQESITSTGVFRVAASGPLYTLYTTTTVHTVHRVKYTPCVRKFYNFAMWRFLFGFVSGHVPTRSNMSVVPTFIELRLDSPSNYVTYQLCFTPSKWRFVLVLVLFSRHKKCN